MKKLLKFAIAALVAVGCGDSAEPAVEGHGYDDAARDTSAQGDAPGDRSATEDRSATDGARPGDDVSSSDASDAGRDGPSTDDASDDQSVTDTSTADQSATDTSAADQVTSDQSSSDRGLADQTGADQGTVDASSGPTDGDGDGGDQADRSADLPDTSGADTGVTSDAAAEAASPCGGPCRTPPTPCHALSGQCLEGRCEYAFIEGAPCDDGNACTVDDSCSAGACTGVPKPCTSPPAPVCVSATELRTYDTSGLCNQGLCVYTRRTVDCGPAGCDAQSCRTDPCAGVVCNTPPSGCYQATGTCQSGRCTYPYQDGVTCDDGSACTENDRCVTGVCVGSPKACANPPASTCENDFTARIYDPRGSCSAGNCSYPYRFVTCATGCANGRCNDSGWRSMVSNSNVNLFAVWGSSASAVWAGGDQGTALYFNGSIWQSRPTPAEVTSQRIISIHGTDASNVFAQADNVLIRYDGTQWRFVASLGVGSSSFHDVPACVFAYGENDAFVFGPHTNSSDLYRVTGGTATKVGTLMRTNGSFGVFPYTCGVYAFSPTNVIVSTGSGTFRFDGATFSDLTSGFVSYGEALYVAGPNAIFVMPSSSLVREWTGSGYANLTTGLNGNQQAIHGTSESRVFLAGTAGLNSTVLRYDGQGWTVEPIPTLATTLTGIYAAPTGEVFAVGYQGNIITGP